MLFWIHSLTKNSNGLVLVTLQHHSAVLKRGGSSVCYGLVFRTRGPWFNSSTECWLVAGERCQFISTAALLRFPWAKRWTPRIFPGRHKCMCIPSYKRLSTFTCECMSVFRCLERVLDIPRGINKNKIIIIIAFVLEMECWMRLVLKK